MRTHLNTHHLILVTDARCCSCHHCIDLSAEVAIDLGLFGIPNQVTLVTLVSQNYGLATRELFGTYELARLVVEDVASSANSDELYIWGLRAEAVIWGPLEA